MYCLACRYRLSVHLPLVCIVKNREVVKILLKRCWAAYTESRSGPHWRRAKEAAKERDGHKCLSCGSKKRLEVHHGNGWRWFREYRFSLWNLFTLCKPCHTAFHKWNGGFRKKCTIHQFRKWMNIPKKRRLKK